MRLVPGTLLVAVLCSVFPSRAQAQACPNGGIPEGGCTQPPQTCGCDPEINPNQCRPNMAGPPTWTWPGWQQTRRGDISPSSTWYTTLPSSSVPNCNGSATVPAGSPWPSISVRLVGTRIWVYYDAPNFYCKNAGDWPPFFTCVNDLSAHGDRLDLYLNGSVDRLSWIYFDYGKWDTGVDVTPCTRYKASIGYGIQLGTRSAWSAEETFLTNDTCPPPDRGSCPAGGGGQGAGMGAGKPINVGSGDVATQVPLFSIQQPPLSLDFTLSYHSSAYTYGFSPAIPEPLGRGWTHPYNQILKPIPATNRLLHYTADGKEFEYTQSGSVWNASRPAELRGTVSTLVDATKCPTPTNTCYVLTDLDGGKTFFDYDGTNAGKWRRTEDRWTNTISGTYTSGNLTTITDSMGRQVVLTYVGSLIDTITVPETPTSRVWSFSYTSGNLTGIRDPLHTSSDWRTLGYDGGNRLTSIADDAAQLLEGHTYDAVSGRGLTSFSGTGDQDFVQVEYDVPGPAQRRVTHRIDSTTNQVSIFNVAYQGGRWRPQDIVGSCATCGGASGDTQSFFYTPDNYVQWVIDGKGNATKFEYDANGNMTSMTEALGVAGKQRTTTYEYGYTTWPHFLTKKTEQSVAKSGQSRFTSYTWTVPETQLTVTESGYKQASDSTPTTYSTVSTFDSRHRLLSIDGPRLPGDVTDVTQWEYYADANSDEGGRLHLTTDATGLVTQYASYDVFGTARSTTDPNLVVTTRVTDPRGRTQSVTIEPVGSDPNELTPYTTTYSFDSRDRLEWMKNPRGKSTRYEYQPGTNRLVNTILVDGAVGVGNEHERLHLTLNDIGGTTREESQSCDSPATTCLSWTTKRQEDFKYNDKNRLVEIDHPDASKIINTYDADGLLATVQDERHASANTTYTYDALNRLSVVTQTLAGAPGNQITATYEYDAHDNLKRVTDPNTNQTNYTFDDFRRMTSQSGAAGATTYTYDEAGNLIDSTDANSVLTHRTYDAVNRLLTAESSKSGLSTEKITNTWGAAAATPYTRGRLLTADVQVDGSSTITTGYLYERRGLLTSETQTILGTAYTTGYGYDTNGNRSSVVYPSTRQVTYAFDFADRPTSVTGQRSPDPPVTYVSSLTYYPFGPERVTTFGNGTIATRSYDTRYLPLENKLTTAALVAIADFTYGTDDAGNITSILDATNSAFDRSPLAYDDLNRLTGATTGASLWGAGSYGYDNMGNMLSQTLGSRVSTFGYVGTTPLLSNVTTNSVTTSTPRDSAGNLTNYFFSRTYSARNLLSRIDCPGYPQRPGYCNTHLKMEYDARGIRTVRSNTIVMPQNRTYQSYAFYLPELSLLAETNLVRPELGVPPVSETEYIWLNGHPVAQEKVSTPSATKFTFVDHLGTPILQTDSASSVTWWADHEPYGNVFSLRAGSASEQILRLPGQEMTLAHEDGTEESYNIARYYHSAWGRYTQKDPLLNPSDSGSTYLYAAADPLSITDPTGEALRYGNYCGPGQEKKRPKPIDPIDTACQTHDDCYDKAHIGQKDVWFPPNPTNPKHYQRFCAKFGCDTALCKFALGYEGSAKTQKQKTVLALIRQQFCYPSVCPACPAPDPAPTPTPNPHPIEYK